MESSYQVVARALRRRILDGEFRDGRRVPTETELAATFAVSRHTIRRAFQDLVVEGLVERVRGRGTFVRPTKGGGYIRQVGSIDDLMSLSADTTMRVVSPLTRKVDLETAGRLHLSADVVYELALVRSHGDVPFCFTTVFLPPHVAALLGDVSQLHAVDATSTLTVIGLVDQLLPTSVREAQQSITVELLPASEARELGCHPRRPTLRIDRLYSDAGGQVVELATSHFLPEHYSYRVSLQRSG